MYIGLVVHSHSSAQKANTELEHNSCEDRERPQLIQSQNIENSRVTLKLETARAMVLLWQKSHGFVLWQSLWKWEKRKP